MALFALADRLGMTVRQLEAEFEDNEAELYEWMAYSRLKSREVPRA